MGSPVQGAAGLERSRRAFAERGHAAGALRQRHLHLFRLCFLQAAGGRSTRGSSVVCESCERGTLMSSPPGPTRADQPALAREIGLREATALNMIDMIGVGPFITIPLIISAMHGPQAMLGWVLGALLAMC